MLGSPPEATKTIASTLARLGNARNESRSLATMNSAFPAYFSRGNVSITGPDVGLMKASVGCASLALFWAVSKLCY